MTMTDKLCVVIPVYNEQDVIAAVLEKWDSMLKSLAIDYEIRPYNDGSKDNSLSVMRDVAARIGNAITVKDKTNGGHGQTILVGYREATEDGFDWVFQVDSDDEMGPEKFSELWARKDDYDFLVGRREGRIQTLSRKAISFVSRLCVRLFYGKSIWDVNTPYRLMRVSAFKEFFDEIPLTTFAPNVILSGLAARQELRCFEMRVPQHNRTTGEVSIKKWKLLKAAAKSLWQTIWLSRPQIQLSKLEILVFAVSYTITVLSYSCSPLINHPYTDSSVFVYVGRVMQRGGSPYVDVFDHKGPLLYLLNYAGLFLTGGTVGVWIEECLFLLISSLIFFLCLHCLFGQIPTLISIVSFFCLITATSDGNLTESWGLCFEMLILVHLIKVLHSSKWSRKWGLLSGAAIASLSLLRPNLVPIGIFYVVAIIHDCSLKKDWKVLCKALFDVMLGGFCVLVPIIGWLFYAGCAKACWEYYIVFNFKYLSAGGVVSYWNYTFISYIFLYSTFVILSKYRKRRIFVIITLCAMFNWLVIAVKPTYDHYYEILIPQVVFLIAMACASGGVVRRFVCILPLVPVLAGCGYGGICAALRPWMDLNLAIVSLKRGSFFDDASNIFCPAYKRDRLASEILSFKPYIKDLQSVTVLGNKCFVYEVLGAQTPWRYPYQEPIINISGDILDEVKSALGGGVSRYIIKSKQEILPFAEDLPSKYRCISQTVNYELWELAI